VSYLPICCQAPSRRLSAVSIAAGRARSRTPPSTRRPPLPAARRKGSRMELMVCPLQSAHTSSTNRMARPTATVAAATKGRQSPPLRPRERPTTGLRKPNSPVAAPDQNPHSTFTPGQKTFCQTPTAYPSPAFRRVICCRLAFAVRCALEQSASGSRRLPLPPPGPSSEKKEKKRERKNGRRREREREREREETERKDNRARLKRPYISLLPLPGLFWWRLPRPHP